MTIQLPEDLAPYVRMNVLSGRFASEAEVIREAVRLLRQREGTEPLTVKPRSAAIAVEPVWKRVLNIMGKVPDDVFDRIPADSSGQLDHYIYGSPKRPAS